MQDDTAYQNMHRQRLVEYGKTRTDVMDVGCVDYVQCVKKSCWEMFARYGLKA